MKWLPALTWQLLLLFTKRVHHRRTVYTYIDISLDSDISMSESRDILIYVYYYYCWLLLLLSIISSVSRMTVIQYVSRWHHGYSALHAFWQCSDGHSYVCLDIDYLYYLQPHALLKHCITVPGRTRSGWSTVAYTIYYLYIIHHLINVGRGVQSTLHPVNIGVCVCVHACVCMRARVCVCVCVCLLSAIDVTVV